MKRHELKTELVSLVADLRAAGYGASDIGRAVNRTPERISQILRDLHLVRPRLRSADDLPHDLRQRVVAFKSLQITNDS